jgi:hypothetical protein
MSKLKITLVKGRYGFAEPTADFPTNLAENHHVVVDAKKPLVRVLLAATETAAAALKGKEIEPIYAGNDQITGFPMYQVAGATKALNNVRYEQRIETALERGATLIQKATAIAKAKGVTKEELLGLYMQQAKNAAIARSEGTAQRTAPTNLVQQHVIGTYNS